MFSEKRLQECNFDYDLNKLGNAGINSPEIKLHEFIYQILLFLSKTYEFCYSSTKNLLSVLYTHFICHSGTEEWIYFTTACLHSQCQLLTNNINLKKSQLLFPYISLKNLKRVESCKSYFNLKHLFRHPFDYDGRDGRTTAPFIHTPLQKTYNRHIKLM